MNSIILIVVFAIILVLSQYVIPKNTTCTIKEISDLTDQWIKEVTVNHDPDAIHKLFCEDGNLIGTVSQVKRKGMDIRRYFDYFSKLPGIQVTDKQYNISKVTDRVFINTAFIAWYWDGLETPLVARMSFVFRDNCIFQLHSSKLPGINDKLLQISDMN